MRKIYILILIILIISVVIITGWISYPGLYVRKQSDTQNNIDISRWKTYRNEEFGFEMKYPTNWFVSGNAITSYDPKTVMDDKLQALVPYRAKFEFYSEPLCLYSTHDNCSISLEDYLTSKKSSGLPIKILSKSSVVQDGLQGIIIE